MSPFFSAIIPTFNRRQFIINCLDSILKQSLDDFEIIIVDDGSTDKTMDILPKYLGRCINYLYTEHRGVSHARNVGIRNSTGKYIAFLDSDDQWDERKLELAFKYIGDYPDINIFHTDEIWYRRGKILKQKYKHKRRSGYVYEFCLPLCCIGMSTSVVKRTLFDKTGFFDEGLPACEDYDFWLRACLDNEVKLIPEPLTIKDGGREDQLSNQRGLDRYRIYSLEKMLNSGRLSAGQRAATYNELLNKCEIYASGAAKRGRSEEAEEYLCKIKKYE